MSPPSSASLPLPTPNHPFSMPQHCYELPEKHSKFPLATCFTRGNACDSMLLSDFFHPLLPTLCPQAVLYVCICIQFSSVQFSHVQLFMTPRTAACQASLSVTNSWSLLKLMSTESVMLSNHLILCHPLLLQPSVFPSIRVFSDESVL